MSKPLPKKVSDLNPAKYNPRTITDSRLRKLGESIHTYGDLSGVVFNIRTQTLVSGHQRMKSIKGLSSRIVQKKIKDDHGTVSHGYIIADGPNGEIRIPYRAVSWDILKEKAANIAANAHGGSFDKEKLQLVLADIDKNAKFDIELTGLDPLTLKTLRPREGEEEFPEYNENTVTTEHTCPRCNYRW